MNPFLIKKNFQCNRFCGECCKRYIVGLTNTDIKRIKQLGYREEEFVDEHSAFNKVFRHLKKNKEGCMFLKKRKNGMYVCSIHRNRPKTCRNYPFFNNSARKIRSCLPDDMYPNVLLRLPSGKYRRHSLKPG